ELAPIEGEALAAADTGTYVDYETPGGVRPGHDDVSEATDAPPDQPPRMPTPERTISPSRAAIPPLAPLPPSAGGFAGAAPTGDAGGGPGGGSGGGGRGGGGRGWVRGGRQRGGWARFGRSQIGRAVRRPALAGRAGRPRSLRARGTR